VKFSRTRKFENFAKMLVFQIFSKNITKPFVLKHFRGNKYFLSILVLSNCAVLYSLSYPGWRVRPICPDWPVSDVLSQLSCPRCPACDSCSVMAVMPRMSCPFCPSQMSCSCCFFLPSCPLFLGLAVLSRLSSLVILSWLSCPGRPVPDVLSRLFCSGSSVLVVLS
jgi:hypothetical protein